MRKGAIWACHAYNPAKRANDTLVLRVEVRIYIAVRVVVNRKASIRHHWRLGKTGVTAERDKIEFRLFNSSSIFNITLREELFSYWSKTTPCILILVSWRGFAPVRE